MRSTQPVSKTMASSSDWLVSVSRKADAPPAALRSLIGRADTYSGFGLGSIQSYSHQRSQPGAEDENPDRGVGWAGWRAMIQLRTNTAAALPRL
jgi:hypothetical protein